MSKSANVRSQCQWEHMKEQFFLFHSWQHWIFVFVFEMYEIHFGRETASKSFDIYQT